MTPEKRRAYCSVLFEALLKIRSECWRGAAQRSADPSALPGPVESLERIGIIADQLHNLPMFLSYDGEGFDEEFFWTCMNKRKETAGYQKAFEEFLRKQKK